MIAARLATKKALARDQNEPQRKNYHNRQCKKLYIFCLHCCKIQSAFDEIQLLYHKILEAKRRKSCNEKDFQY